MPRKPPPFPSPLALQGDLDVFSVQAQWEGLHAYLSAHEGPLLLDLTSVGDLDLSGLQLLLALDQHLAGRGDRLSLSGAKPEWLDRFRPMGLATILEERP